jgi:MerR family transcriptional regulator, light-induced transcriptional regulator
MVFDEVEPLNEDNRRLLAAISAAVGFALLRDRLVRELQAAAPTPGRPWEGLPPAERFARPAAGATPPGG